MMIQYKYRIVLAFVVYNFLVGSLFVYPQQILELKEKKKVIEKEIEMISDLITKTEKESSRSANNIKLTRKKIDLKNNLIREIDRESEQIRNQINLRKRKVDSLNFQVVVIKNEYKKLIVYTQKTRSKNSILLLLLSSKDFNQAYKRIKFYQQILKYKTQIAQRYNYTINQITEENTQLNENISLLSKRQNEKESEILKLRKEEKTYTQKAALLSKKKKELLDELEGQRRITKRINDEIKRLIAEEARKELENSKLGSKSTQILLSNNFKENIGKFSIPVNNGIVTGVYGESFHPILKEIKIKNNGIDITISKKSDVYTIYKGEVRKIFKIPGSNLAIIIRHGRYLSVYSNLSSVIVSVGQDINSYQKIGEINLQNGEETAILHFEIWNENKTEDPSKWFKGN